MVNLLYLVTQRPPHWPKSYIADFSKVSSLDIDHEQSGMSATGSPVAELYILIQRIHGYQDKDSRPEAYVQSKTMSGKEDDLGESMRE